MGTAETRNHLQVVARIEDYYRGFAAEPVRQITKDDYQKALAELATAAASILALTEILTRIGPPVG